MPEAPVVSERQRPLPLEDADAAIAGHPPAYYLKKTRGFVVIGVILHVIAFALHLSGLYGWFIKLVLAALLGVIFVGPRHLTPKVAAAGGATLGLVMGLIVAIIEIVWYRQLWTVFNLIAEPLATALLGLAASWLFGVLTLRMLVKERR